MEITQFHTAVAGARDGFGHGMLLSVPQNPAPLACPGGESSLGAAAFLFHVLLRIQYRIVADSDVAARVGDVSEGQAVLAWGGRSQRRASRQADHITVPHTLALLFAAVVKPTWSETCDFLHKVG